MRRRQILVRVAGTAFLVLMLIPILAVVVVSLLDDAYIRFPPANGFTLRWFAEFWTTGDLGSATFESVRIAVVATVISLALGTAGAIAADSLRSKRAKSFIDTFLILPLLVPSVVIAPAIYASGFWIETNTQVPVLRSGVLLFAAHVVITLPWTYRLVSAGMGADLRSLERASRSLGGSRWQTFRSVTMPILRPHILGAALFAFIFSFTNLEISLFLITADRTTLPVALMQRAIFEVDPVLAAAAVVQMTLVAVLMIIAGRFVGFGSVLRK